MRLGVDFSQYGGELTQQTIACWKSQGVDHAIVQYSERMPQHLDALKQAGRIEIQAYVYLYWGLSPWGQTPLQRTKAAITMCAKKASFLWLDAEDTTHPFSARELMECVSYCNSVGMPCGIYTGSWYWVDHTNNNKQFSNLPLWDAYYISQSSNADLSKFPKDFSYFRPYGGWNSPAIWQWHNTTLLCEHSVDLNAIPDSISNPIEEGDEDMRSWHAWANWFINKTIGGGQSIYVIQAKTDWQLPDEAKAVMFNADLEVNSNVPEFFHGGTDIPAGSLGANTYIVNLTAEGTFNFRCQAEVTFKNLHCIGYYR